MAQLSPGISEASPPGVTFVLTSLSLGGAEGQFARLAVQLRRRGYRIRMICLQQSTPTVEWLRAHDVPVEVCDAARGPVVRRAGVLLGVTARLVWRWWHDPPDIVHGVLVHGYLLAGIAARLARVPLFVSSRRSLSLFKAKRPMLKLLERFVNRHTALVIANSEAVRRDAMHTEALPAGLVEVIYNGIMPREFEDDCRERIRRELHATQDARVAICVANLIHYKGHDVLVEAWREVARLIPDAVLWLVGDGPERDEIRRMVTRSGLEASVFLLGSRADVPHLLRGSDLLVHPSRQEGFCNALLEGMAAAVPVVATDAGGNREAVEDGVTGVLVPVDDPHLLAAAVVRLLGDPASASQMGRAGAARVAKRFLEDRMVQDYDDAYRRLLAREHRPT